MSQSLLTALQFLTTFPVRTRDSFTTRVVGRAMAWFPAVGMMLGGVLGIADMGLRLLLPATTSAGLVVGLWVLLTGALHLDGLMDCCDGLLAAREPERRLEIMRDTHLGAFAVVGAVCVLMTKYTALADLSPELRLAVLLAVPTLSRAAMVYAARAYPYARSESGLGQLFRDGLTWREVVIASLTAVAVALLALGWLGLALAGVVWLVTVATAWWVQRRIPGLTGDVYGAVNELTELSGLLFVLMVGGYK